MGKLSVSLSDFGRDDKLLCLFLFSFSLLIFLYLRPRRRGRWRAVGIMMATALELEWRHSSCTPQIDGHRFPFGRLAALMFIQRGHGARFFFLFLIFLFYVFLY